MKRKIVNVIPATKIAPNRTQVFSYLPPKEGNISPEQLVKITLGNRSAFGVVLNTETKDLGKMKLKNISGIADEKPVLTKPQIELAKWIADYYMTSLGLVIKTMLPKRATRPPKFSPKNIEPDKPHKLNASQSKALTQIFSSKNNTTLLHGVTGSGKTEIYLQAISKILEQGKQAIVMIPEISLTPQTIERFTKRFGAEKIAMLHSKLSYGAKYREWLRIRDEEAKIVIGPRSAIFAPVQKLGLIVIDEEHENSYKQWDQHPRYHAKNVAQKYADLTKAKLILGSATPDIETFYKAKQGKINLAEMPERIKQDKLPKVKIVDMREELAAGNRSVFSENLQTKIGQALENKEQIILFMNRRGAATFVMCRDCGHVVGCPNCSVSLTYHFQNKPLICHHCGFSRETPKICPECSSQRVKFFGSGTQNIEREALKLFPQANILRMDTDTTRKTQSHEKIFREFSDQKANILIGTQMVAKGFDLPNVTLVGIISADTSLNIPDFRAGERTFQLLTQVAGRTGRDKKRGEVVLQTYHPRNPIILAAANHDYKTFYDAELKERKAFENPPFSNFAKLTISGADDSKTKKEALNTVEVLQKKFPEISVIGPAPAIIARKQQKFLWHILLQSTTTFSTDLTKILSANWKIDIDPIDLLS